MDAGWGRVAEEIDKVDDLNFLPSDLARSIPWQWVAVGVGKNNHKVWDHKSIIFVVRRNAASRIFFVRDFPIGF